MHSPLVSVCIPVYNGEAFLSQALGSIVAQSYSEWELIIADDGSTDRTPNVVKEFQKTCTHCVSYIRHETNRGLPTARNTVIGAAKGKYIAFIDADDLWREDHLNSLVTVAERRNVDLTFSGTLLFRSETGQPQTTCVPSPADLNDLPVALYAGRLSILPSSTLLRRDAFDRFGPFCQDFPHANDTEYWLRILRAGGSIGYTGAVTCLYRKHPGAMSLRASRILTNTAQICERYADWRAIPPRLARRRTGSLYRYAARSLLKNDSHLAASLLQRSLRLDPLRPSSWWFYFLSRYHRLKS